MHRGSAIVINTSDELESDALNALSSMFPSLYPIGPLPSSFLNQIPQNHLESLGSNLWKENTEGHGWLESEEPKSVHSVVYVNFGSITVLSPEQLLEFAWGLANNKRPLLLIKNEFGFLFRKCYTVIIHWFSSLEFGFL